MWNIIQYSKIPEGFLKWGDITQIIHVKNMFHIMNSGPMMEPPRSNCRHRHGNAATRQRPLRQWMAEALWTLKLSIVRLTRLTLW
jgi:hypothetical protein